MSRQTLCSNDCVNLDLSNNVQNRFCICCLGTNVPLINLMTCTHSEYLDSFSKPELKSSLHLVCHHCHGTLKKIQSFNQQVRNSFKMLSSLTLNTGYTVREHRFEIHKAVNIHIPETHEPQSMLKEDQQQYFKRETKRSLNQKLDKRQTALDIIKCNSNLSFLSAFINTESFLDFTSLINIDLMNTSQEISRNDEVPSKKLRLELEDEIQSDSYELHPVNSIHEPQLHSNIIQKSSIEVLPEIKFDFESNALQRESDNHLEPYENQQDKNELQLEASCNKQEFNTIPIDSNYHQSNSNVLQCEFNRIKLKSNELQPESNITTLQSDQLHAESNTSELKSNEFQPKLNIALKSDELHPESNIITLKSDELRPESNIIALKSDELHPDSNIILKSDELHSESNQNLNRIVSVPEAYINKLNVVRITEAELNKERALHSLSKQYLACEHRCRHCILGFKYQENYNDHTRRKHSVDVGDFVCKICSQRFGADSDYNDHLSRHYHRYVCVMCEERFRVCDEAIIHYRKKHLQRKSNVQKKRKML